jgi:hypothetical protein
VIARLLGGGLALLALMTGACAATADAGPDVGQGIFLRGIAGSGKTLEASRQAGSKLQGAAAACVNCHQRSGLGGREGRTLVPPITGRYLFRPRAGADADRDIPFVEGMRPDREPYTETTLARAVREGIDSSGQPLSYLMPRYALGDADMAALAGYLRKLDRRKVPGVTDSTLHFATIVTPEADPVKRRGMLEVMRQFFADRNVRQMVPAPTMRSSGKTTYAKSMFMVHRRWELHVWELSGPPSSWQQQLDKHLAAEPVFAVLSGIGGRNWAPVHAFCERAALPCLYPNVEVPVDRPEDFYGQYFSKGVLLEAELLAQELVQGMATSPRPVLQVLRAGDSGEEGSQALAALLERRGIAVRSLVVPAGEPAAAIAAALSVQAPGQALVLWLRPPDLSALGEMPSGFASVLLSGLLGGLEHAPLPASWRQHASMAYPFDLPDRRRVRVDFALGWFRARHIPVVAEQVQADTYLACSLVSETLNHMVDTFVRDYLVERSQAMLEHRIVTGYYPRLALATGQHFASKGGYIVAWPDPVGAHVVAQGDWTVP